MRVNIQHNTEWQHNQSHYAWLLTQKRHDLIDYNRLSLQRDPEISFLLSLDINVLCTSSLPLRNCFLSNSEHLTVIGSLWATMAYTLYATYRKELLIVGLQLMVHKSRVTQHKPVGYVFSSKLGVQWPHWLVDSVFCLCFIYLTGISSICVGVSVKHVLLHLYAFSYYCEFICWNLYCLYWSCIHPGNVTLRS